MRIGRLWHAPLGVIASANHRSLALDPLVLGGVELGNLSVEEERNRKVRGDDETDEQQEVQEETDREP